VPNTIDVNFGATIFLTLTLGEWRMDSGLESGVGRSNMQTVNAKSKQNNYRSSAECWSVAEPNRAEAFGRTFGRCSALTKLWCTSTPSKV